VSLLNRKIKLAIVQRVCPHYRVAVFKKLSELFDVIVFFGKGTSTGTYKNADRLEGFKYRILPSLEKYLEIGRKGYYISFFPTLVKELRKGRFDVIITEGTTNLLNNLALFICKAKLKAPIIWWDAGRQTDAPMGFIRRLAEPIIRRMILKSDGCLGYGDIAEKYFLSIGVLREKIYIAQNTMAIQEDTINSEEMHKLVEDIKLNFALNGKKVLLYAGSLEKRKKIDFLLKILKAFHRKDIVLFILGDGPDEDRLKKLSKNLQIDDRVYFMGRRIEDRAVYFQLADVYVVPSMYGFINIALLYKKPVVVNQYIAEIELVKHGVNGFICEDENVDAFLNAILKLIDDPSMAKSFGVRGWEMIKEKADFGKMIEGIVYAVKNTIH